MDQIEEKHQNECCVDDLRDFRDIAVEVYDNTQKMDKQSESGDVPQCTINHKSFFY